MRVITGKSEVLPDALDSLGVLVLQLGPDGSVLGCNEALAEIVGVPPGSLIGRHHQGLFGALDAPRACVTERTVIRDDGEPRKIRWSITPKFDSTGMPNGMSCVGIELPTSVLDLDSASEATRRKTSDGVFLIDGNGNIERINRAAARVLDVGEDELTETPVGGLGSGRYREHPGDDRHACANSGGEGTKANLLGLRSEGHEVPLKLHVEEVKSDDTRYYMGVPRDASDIGAYEERERRHAKHLQTLREVIRASASVGPRELTKVALPRIADLMGVNAAAVVLNVDSDEIVEFFGLPSETSIMVKELLAAGEFEPATMQALTRMYVATSIPLRGSMGQLGHLLLFSRDDGCFDAEHQEMLESLTHSFTVALENFVMTREIESVKASRDSAHESILRAMVAALELRDHETEGHTQRVTRVSVQLAESLGLAGDELRNLEHGALLHDIGKIGIPDAILHKPGPLTSNEWEVMRKHPQYAYDILSPLPHLSHALDVPYCHHERYDGSGYPRGLRGPEIPLAARIFAVVDVYDAMTTERPYRPALPGDYALAHLKSHSGTHFDPVVVDAFCVLVDGWT